MDKYLYDLELTQCGNASPHPRRARAPTCPPTRTHARANDRRAHRAHPNSRARRKEEHIHKPLISLSI